MSANVIVTDDEISLCVASIHRSDSVDVTTHVSAKGTGLVMYIP